MPKSPNTAEEDFRSILQRFFDGRGTIDEILGHEHFTRWLREWRNGLDFRVFHGKYDRDDIHQDIWVKMWEMGPTLRRPDNIRPEADFIEDDFFNWMRVLGRNHYFSKLRFYRTLTREGLRSDQRVEEVQVPARQTNPEAKALLDRFVTFVKDGDYPDACKCAVGLWLEDYSFRDIADVLTGKGVLNSKGEPFTHVTIRNWVMAVIRDFRKSRGLPTPRKLRKEWTMRWAS